MLSRSFQQVACRPMYSLCEKQISKCRGSIGACSHGYQTSSRNDKAAKEGFRSIVQNKKKILCVSTAMVQNKSGVIEMPFIIRKIGNDVIQYENKPVKKLQNETETFANELKNCTKIEDIFKLLMIPREHISSAAAISSLLRLHKLEQMSKDYSNDWSLDSFLSQAVMDELFAVIAKDLQNVNNLKLIRVIDAYLESSEGKYIDHVFRLAEAQIADSRFSVDELMQLNRVLTNSMEKYEAQGRSVDEHKDMHVKVWVHLINRNQDITPSNIVQILEEFPSEMKKDLLRPLMHHVTTIGWHLQGQNMADILNHMIRLRERNMKILEDMGKWVSNVIQNVQAQDLTDIVQAFRYYRFYSPALISTLEKYVTAKRDKVNIDLLCKTLEYFRDFRYFSAPTLDTAAFVFTKKGLNFTHNQMFEILIQFGYFNYFPSESRKLFMVVEPLLLLHAYDFPADKFIELLCYFNYMSVKLLNFDHVIFSSKMFKRILELDANRCNRALFHQQHLTLQTPGISLRSRLRYKTIRQYDVPSITDQYQARNVLQFKKLLRLILRYKDGHIWEILKFNKNWRGITIDCSFAYNKDENVFYKWRLIPYSKGNSRVIFMVNFPEHRCVNTGHDLGKRAFVMRYLKEQYTDATIIDIPYETLQVFPEALEFMKEKLSFLPQPLRTYS